MSSKQASYFLDFWLRSMKLHQPGVSDLDHLEAFRNCLEAKRREVQSKRIKRESPAAEENDFDDNDTTIDNDGDESLEDTPPEDPPTTQASEMEMSAEPQAFVVSGTMAELHGAAEAFVDNNIFGGESEVRMVDPMAAWYEYPLPWEG